MRIPLTKEQQLELVHKAWKNLCAKYDAMGTSMVDFIKAEKMEDIDAAWLEACSNYQFMGVPLKEFALLLAGVLEDDKEEQGSKSGSGGTKILKLSNVRKDAGGSGST